MDKASQNFLYGQFGQSDWAKVDSWCIEPKKPDVTATRPKLRAGASK